MDIRFINFFLIIHVSLCCALPQVQISNGILRGTIHQTRKGREVAAFLGIPYAEPPVGDLRFRNPVPAKSWEGVLDATKNGNSCSHYSLKLQRIGVEDCLFLNVYIPLEKFNTSMSENNSSEELLPVMVWIHGGAFLMESSNSHRFGANYLLDKNVILVSMNYRLGIFGFLSTGDEIVSGNFGLKDQNLALKWVQKNIQAFGGDPKKVTIFGESAGGACVALHALSDASEGLFHQYIIQSGSPLAPWAFQKSSNYPPLIRLIAKNVGCAFEEMGSIINCFRNKTVTQLLDASTSIDTVLHEFTQILKWTPTNEPETAKDAFLTDFPINLINKNKLKDMPFITGNVLNEGLVVTQVFYQNSIMVFTAAHMGNFLLNFKIPFLNQILERYFEPENVERFKKEIENFYSSKSFLPSGRQLMEQFTNFLSDALFNYPEMVFVEKATEKIKSPVYFYSFDYEGSRSFTQLQTGTHVKEGVCHGDDTFYLFPMNFSSPNELRNEKVDSKMIDIMVDLWTSFAIEGTPKSNNFTWIDYQQTASFLSIGGKSNNPRLSFQQNYVKNRMDFWKSRAHFP